MKNLISQWSYDLEITLEADHISIDDSCECLRKQVMAF